MIKAIYKYKMLMNGCVSISCLAETEDAAVKNAERLFDADDKFEVVEVTFSHNTGDYSIAKKVKVAQVERERPIVVKKKVDLVTNVMDEYAKNRKVDL